MWIFIVYNKTRHHKVHIRRCFSAVVCFRQVLFLLVFAAHICEYPLNISSNIDIILDLQYTVRTFNRIGNCYGRKI